MLQKYRHKDNLIVISSDPFSIVAAMHQGYQTVPIIQFESFLRSDFQLNLVENYLLKLRYGSKVPETVKNNFKFLTSSIESFSKKQITESSSSDGFFGEMKEIIYEESKQPEMHQSKLLKPRG